MKRSILITLLIVVILLTAPFLFLNNIVKTAIEEVGPNVVGASITVDAVDLSPFSGKGSLSHITVANPQGFSGKHSISIQHVSFHVDVSSLLSDTVVIRNISIVEPHIIYELSAAGSNISALAKGSKQKASSETPEKSEQSALIIEQLVIKNGKLNTQLGDVAGAGITLPTIEMHDLGKEKETHVADIIAKVLETLVGTVAKADLSSLEGLAKGAAKNATDKLKGLSDKVNGLFGN